MVSLTLDAEDNRLVRPFVEACAHGAPNGTVEFTFERDRIDVSGVDKANVSMVEASLPTGGLARYEAEGGPIGIDIGNLREAVREVNKTDPIEIRTDAPTIEQVYEDRANFREALDLLAWQGYDTREAILDATIDDLTENFGDTHKGAYTIEVPAGVLDNDDEEEVEIHHARFTGARRSLFGYLVVTSDGEDVQPDLDWDERPQFTDQYRETDIPDLEWDATATVDGGRWERVVRAADQMTNHILHGIHGTDLALYGEGDTDDISSLLPGDATGPNCGTLYSLEFLRGYRRGLDRPATTEMTFSFAGTEFPMRVEFAVGPDREADIEYMLAPRIQTDGAGGDPESTIERMVDRLDQPLSDEEFHAATEGAHIRPFIDAMAAHVDESVVHAYDDGLETSALDPANVVLTVGYSPADAFEEYAVPDEGYHQLLGLGYNRIQSYLKYWRKRDTFEMAADMEVRRLAFEHPDFRISYALIDPDAMRQHPTLPDSPLTGWCHADTEQFRATVRECAGYSGSVWLRYEDGTLTLESDQPLTGDAYEEYAPSGHDPETDGAIYYEETVATYGGEGMFASHYSGDYLVNWATSFRYETPETVELRAGYDMPLVIEWSVAEERAFMLQMLSPRIDSDDQTDIPEEATDLTSLLGSYRLPRHVDAPDAEAGGGGESERTAARRRRTAIREGLDGLHSDFDYDDLLSELDDWNLDADLTSVSGVGPSTADDIEEAGYPDLLHVAWALREESAKFEEFLDTLSATVAANLRSAGERIIETLLDPLAAPDVNYALQKVYQQARYDPDDRHGIHPRWAEVENEEIRGLWDGAWVALDFEDGYEYFHVYGGTNEGPILALGHDFRYHLKPGEEGESPTIHAVGGEDDETHTVEHFRVRDEGVEVSGPIYRALPYPDDEIVGILQDSTRQGGPLAPLYDSEIPDSYIRDPPLRSPRAILKLVGEEVYVEAGDGGIWTGRVRGYTQDPLGVHVDIDGVQGSETVSLDIDRPSRYRKILAAPAAPLTEGEDPTPEDFEECEFAPEFERWTETEATAQRVIAGEALRDDEEPGSDEGPEEAAPDADEEPPTDDEEREEWRLSPPSFDLPDADPWDLEARAERHPAWESIAPMSILDLEPGDIILGLGLDRVLAQTRQGPIVGRPETRLYYLQPDPSKGVWYRRAEARRTPIEGMSDITGYTEDADPMLVDDIQVARSLPDDPVVGTIFNSDSYGGPPDPLYQSELPPGLVFRPYIRSQAEALLLDGEEVYVEVSATEITRGTVEGPAHDGAGLEIYIPELGETRPWYVPSSSKESEVLLFAAPAEALGEEPDTGAVPEAADTEGLRLDWDGDLLGTTRVFHEEHGLGWKRGAAPGGVYVEFDSAPDRRRLLDPEALAKVLEEPEETRPSGEGRDAEDREETEVHRRLREAIEEYDPPPEEWEGVTRATLNPTTASLRLQTEGYDLSVAWRQTKRDWVVTRYNDADWTRNVADVTDALDLAREAAARVSRGEPAFVTGPGTDDESEEPAPEADAFPVETRIVWDNGVREGRAVLQSEHRDLLDEGAVEAVETTIALVTDETRAEDGDVLGAVTFESPTEYTIREYTDWLDHLSLEDFDIEHGSDPDAKPLKTAELVFENEDGTRAEVYSEGVWLVPVRGESVRLDESVREALAMLDGSEKWTLIEDNREEEVDPADDGPDRPTERPGIEVPEPSEMLPAELQGLPSPDRDDEPIEVWNLGGASVGRIYTDAVYDGDTEMAASPEEAARMARTNNDITPLFVPDDSPFGPPADDRDDDQPDDQDDRGSRQYRVDPGEDDRDTEGRIFGDDDDTETEYNGIPLARLPRRLQAIMPGADIEFRPRNGQIEVDILVGDDAGAVETDAEFTDTSKTVVMTRSDLETGLRRVIAQYDAIVDPDSLDLSTLETLRANSALPVGTTPGGPAAGEEGEPPEEVPPSEEDEEAPIEPADSEPSGGGVGEDYGLDLSERERSAIVEAHAKITTPSVGSEEREQAGGELIEPIVLRRVNEAITDIRLKLVFQRGGLVALEMGLYGEELSPNAADTYPLKGAAIFGDPPYFEVGLGEVDLVKLIRKAVDSINLLDREEPSETRLADKLNHITSFTRYRFENGHMNIADMLLTRDEFHELNAAMFSGPRRVYSKLEDRDEAWAGVQHVYALATTEGLSPEDVTSGTGSDDRVLMDVQEMASGFSSADSTEGHASQAFDQWLNGEFDAEMYLRNYYKSRRREVPSDIFVETGVVSHPDERTTTIGPDNVLTPRAASDRDPDEEPDEEPEPAPDEETDEETEPEPAPDEETEPEPDEDTAEDAQRRRAARRRRVTRLRNRSVEVASRLGKAIHDARRSEAISQRTVQRATALRRQLRLTIRDLRVSQAEAYDEDDLELYADHVDVGEEAARRLEAALADNRDATLNHTVISDDERGLSRRQQRVLNLVDSLSEEANRLERKIDEAEYDQTVDRARLSRARTVYDEAEAFIEMLDGAIADELSEDELDNAATTRDEVRQQIRHTEEAIEEAQQVEEEAAAPDYENVPLADIIEEEAPLPVEVVAVPQGRRKVWGIRVPQYPEKVMLEGDGIADDVALQARRNVDIDDFEEWGVAGVAIVSTDEIHSLSWGDRLTRPVLEPETVDAEEFGEDADREPNGTPEEFDPEGGRAAPDRWEDLPDDRPVSIGEFSVGDVSIENLRLGPIDIHNANFGEVDPRNIDRIRGDIEDDIE